MEGSNNTFIKNNQLSNSQVTGRFFAQIDALEDLIELQKQPFWGTMPYMVISDGSNFDLKSGFDGIIIYNAIKNMVLLGEDNEKTILEVGSGVLYEDIRLYGIEHGYLSTKSMKPYTGSVGSSIVKNMYDLGGKSDDIIYEIQIYNLINGQLKRMNPQDCDLNNTNNLFQLHKENFIVGVKYLLSSE